MISSPGVALLSDKVAALRDYSEPNTYRQLGGSVGLANCYQLFVPNCAEIVTSSETCYEEVNVGLRFPEPQNKRLPPSRKLSPKEHHLKPRTRSTHNLIVNTPDTAAGPVLHQYKIQFFANYCRVAQDWESQQLTVVLRLRYTISPTRVWLLLCN